MLQFPKIMKSLFVLFVSLVVSFGLLAQPAVSDKVFVLGADELRYEQLTSTHTQSLLEATGNNITRAFEGWLDMQQAMDVYAEQQRYDLNGVKLLLHVFWAADGGIDQIGFLVHTDSRLVNQQEIRALLAGFAKQYRLPVQSTQGFSHYTAASFPTYSQRKG